MNTVSKPCSVAGRPSAGPEAKSPVADAAATPAVLDAWVDAGVEASPGEGRRRVDWRRLYSSTRSGGQYGGSAPLRPPLPVS